MFNKKAVILNGLARGGTNITWNILQSHPNIVSPVFETNQIIGGRSLLAPLKPLLTLKGGIPPLIRNYINHRFSRYKLKNLSVDDNKYKTDELLYTKEEVLQATLCIKGICSHNNWDLNFSPLLSVSFPEVYFISLVRNGFAICEGWQRRGVSARDAGILYARYCAQILDYQARFPTYKIIRFEDVLEAPFEMAHELFHFIRESPEEVQKLRIKVKNTLNREKKHLAHYGEENRKYWFTPSTIDQIIRTDINQVQNSGLSEKDKKEFQQEAQEALQHFHYL
jgi:hypothetical protein